MIKKNKIYIEQYKYCCQLCNYPVLSSKNKCLHKLCDYCLTNVMYSYIAECKICEKIVKDYNSS